MITASQPLRIKDLPGKSQWGGYLYVISFSNPEATIKVGSTVNPQARFKDHLGGCRPFGLSIVDWWVSLEHLRYRETEQVLIEQTAKLAAKKYHREYFTGVTFDEAFGVAQFIRYPTRAGEAQRRKEVPLWRWSGADCPIRGTA